MTYQPRPNATTDERLAVIEAVVCDLHNQLLGNGQPGEIEKMRRKQGALEKRVYLVSGAVSVAMAIFMAYLKGLVHL